MNGWKTLLSTAMIGTGRQTPSAPKGNDALSQTLRQLDWKEPEAALLSAAGAIALHRKVGSVHTFSLPNLPTISPCKPEEQACCNQQVAKCLRIVIKDYPALLPEILSLIASMQQRIPPKQLPKLLDFGRSQTALQSLILSVVGKRGQWLSHQNADWQYVTFSGKEDFDSEAFQQQWRSSARRRCSLLQRWREVDSAAARDFLEPKWKEESAKDRDELIEALAVSLSMEDEPFLESVLADRSKSVRHKAGKLLRQLPNSRLCQRMAERAQPFVQFSGRGKSLQICVVLPERFDDSFFKDGIEKAARNRFGEKVSWLHQIVASAPLSVWPEPSVVLNAVKESEYCEALVSGWAIAAAAQKDASWAEGLLKAFGTEKSYGQEMRSLISLISIEKQKTYLESAMPKQVESEGFDIISWLRFVSQPSQRWDLAFSHIVIEQLAKLTESKGRHAALVYDQSGLALTLHPGIAPKAKHTINNILEGQGIDTTHRAFNDKFLSMLTMRWEIYRAIASSSATSDHPTTTLKVRGPATES